MLAEALTDIRVRIRILICGFTVFSLDSNEYASVEKLYQEAITFAQSIGDRQEMAIAYHNYAAALANQERYEEAYQILEQSLQLAREINSHNGIMLGMSNLAYFAIKAERWAEAEAYLNEAMEMSDDTPQIHPNHAFVKACILAEKQQYSDAVMLLNACITHAQVQNSGEDDLKEETTLLAEWAAKLPSSDFAAAIERGKHLSIATAHQMIREGKI